MIDLLYQTNSKISAETHIPVLFFDKGSILTDSKPLILALEASAGQASAALSAGGDVLASAEMTAAHGHAAWMVTLAEDAMAKAKRSPQDLDVIIGGVGPGSFTGIRVALAAAKGFGLTRSLTPVGISSLAGLAAMASDHGHPILAVIDSRRKSYFMQLFDADLNPLSEITDGDMDTVITLVKGHQDQLQNGLMLAGFDGDMIAERLHQLGLKIESIGVANPSAEGLIKAYQRAPQFAVAPEPLYLAPPILGPTQKPSDQR